MATATQSMESLQDILKQHPPSNCVPEPIDFSKTQLASDYSKSFALLIHNLFTPAECEVLLAAAEATSGGKWEQAMVNIGGGRQMMILDARNCGRIIWDDKTITALIMDRIMPYLPAEIVTLKDKPRITGPGPFKRKETWRISKLNERMRFLKYTSGMYFRPHRDGSYVTPNGKMISFLTVHLYLNGDGGEDGESRAVEESREKRDNLEERLEGGATRFFSWDERQVFDILPATGACLVFQHRNLTHSGEDVIKGTKFTLRSDIMYEKVETEKQ